MQVNYNHLHYFWMVAREGSITRAAERLHVTPQTISGQIRALEQGVGTRLFAKNGRHLALTDTGRVVMGFASQMFQLGEQLKDVLSERVISGPCRLAVGVAMVVPKLIAYRVLEPVLALRDKVQLSCHEAPLEDLMEDLTQHRLDLVLADCPFPPASQAAAHSHLLGESGVTFFGDTCSAERYRRGFPASLDGAPMLIPGSSALHDALNEWFYRKRVRPSTVARFDDTALMNAFGEAGAGLFALPTVIERDVLRRYRVDVVGRTREIRQGFYALSTERRLRHPAVTAITERARAVLFGGDGDTSDERDQCSTVKQGSSNSRGQAGVCPAPRFDIS